MNKQQTNITRNREWAYLTGSDICDVFITNTKYLIKYIDEIDYDPDTGELSSETLKLDHYTQEGSGYKVVRVMKKWYLAHRVAMLIRGEIIDGLIVHHKNHVKTDNRLINLEIMSVSQHYKEHRTPESQAITKKRWTEK